MSNSETSLFQIWLNDQNFDAEESKWIYFLIGRMVHEDTVDYPLEVFFKHNSCTGFSSFLLMIVKLISGSKTKLVYQPYTQTNNNIVYIVPILEPLVSRDVNYNYNLNKELEQINEKCKLVYFELLPEFRKHGGKLFPPKFTNKALIKSYNGLLQFDKGLRGGTFINYYLDNN